jgi:hypothetical protein
MSDESSKRHARQFFESVGFTVKEIAPSKVKEELRADIEVSREDDTYVVEAKEKETTNDFVRLVAEARQNTVATVSREPKAWNALSSVIEEADKQLAATPAAPNAVQLMWVSCLHGDAAFIFKALKHRLYGVVTLVTFSLPGPAFSGSKDCFYYDHNDFFRRRNIDGVILAGPGGCQLLVNEFGTRGGTTAKLLLASTSFEVERRIRSGCARKRRAQHRDSF